MLYFIFKVLQYPEPMQGTGYCSLNSLYNGTDKKNSMSKVILISLTTKSQI